MWFGAILGGFCPILSASLEAVVSVGMQGRRAKPVSLHVQLWEGLCSPALAL